MAQVVADFVREVEQEIVALAALPVVRRVFVAQDFQVNIAHRRLVQRQQAAHVAQATGLVEQVQHDQIAAQNLPVLHVDALGAEQQFGSARFKGVVRTRSHALQQIAHAGLRDQVQKQRWQLEVAGPQGSEVPGFECAGGQKRVPKAEEKGVVGADVAIGQAGQFVRGDRATRRCRQCAVQGDFGVAGLVHQGQFRPRQKKPQVVVRGNQPAAFIARALRETAGRPKVRAR